jgi:hypothetical protein
MLPFEYLFCFAEVEEENRMPSHDQIGPPLLGQGHAYSFLEERRDLWLNVMRVLIAHKAKEDVAHL